MVILILFALIFTLLFIFFSINIKLEIENLKISFPKTRKKLTNNNSKVSLKVYILKKIKIVEINLKKIDLKNEKIRNQFKGFNLDTIEFLKKVNYIVEKLNLKCNIGCKDAAITAVSVGIIYMIISNFLKDRIQNIENIEYKVKPLYNNRNVFYVELDSIISIKIKNIIDMITFMKKGRVKGNGRSSNRRSYAYSDE